MAAGSVWKVVSGVGGGDLSVNQSEVTSTNGIEAIDQMNFLEI